MRQQFVDAAGRLCGKPRKHVAQVRERIVSICCQTFTSFTAVANCETRWLKGARDYQLADGTDLNANINGTFSEVGSSEKLRRA